MKYHRKFRDDGSLAFQFKVDESGRPMGVRAFNENSEEIKLTTHSIERCPKLPELMVEDTCILCFGSGWFIRINRPDVF